MLLTGTTRQRESYYFSIKVLTQRPTAFLLQSCAAKSCRLDVLMIICWTSLQPRFGFASKVSAIIPAAIGAEADVP